MAVLCVGLLIPIYICGVWLSYYEPNHRLVGVEEKYYKRGKTRGGFAYSLEWNYESGYFS